MSSETQPGPDAQWFPDAFAEDITHPGFGFGDPASPRAPLIGLVTQHHAYMGLRRDSQANPPGEQVPNRDGVLGGFLDITAHGEPQCPALSGQ